MSDEFVQRLQRDWQSQQHDVSQVLARLRRHRWMPHVALSFEILGCAAALATGIWFAWVAAHQAEHKLLFALSAAVLLVAAPAMAVAIAMARRASLAWHDETPESILRIGIRRADSALQAMRVGRWHLASIAAFTLVLWVLQAAGLIQALQFLVFYTAVSLAVALASLGWMAWRSRKLTGERETCVRLLEALLE